MDEECYKNIIITNILVPVEYFSVSHIRKLLLIQTSGGFLATNLDELGHSCSVLHYMIEFSSLNSLNKTFNLLSFNMNFAVLLRVFSTTASREKVLLKMN